MTKIRELRTIEIDAASLPEAKRLSQDVTESIEAQGGRLVRVEIHHNGDRIRAYVDWVRK